MAEKHAVIMERKAAEQRPRDEARRQVETARAATSDDAPLRIARTAFTIGGTDYSPGDEVRLVDPAMRERLERTRQLVEADTPTGVSLLAKAAG